MRQSPFPDLESVHKRFLDPGPGWGPMPFFWWSGGPVDRDRLRWQLDQLAGSGVAGTVVGYSHRADSSLDADDPQPLTEPWWDLFTWFVGESSRRGLRVGLQDYILMNDILRAAGDDTPGAGAGTLRAQVTRAAVPGPVAVPVAVDAVQVVAIGPEGVPVDLTGDVVGGAVFTWTAPAAGWEVVVVSVEPAALYGLPLRFDALHPHAGQAVIRRLYQPFADRLGEHLGTTFTVFFQDELDLGIRMPMWSPRVPVEFRRRTGYDLMPLLVALWRDIGPATEQVRLEYSDVVVAMLEESYFKPVYQWHRAHGTMLAMDQLGRGDPRVGRSVYGDYSRTMRWYDAPGTEDPKLHEPRRLEGFKVNSSLAHLYARPRVWNEAFHSSGWGATPAEILAGVNEGFAYGATSVSLHGLYHTTHGGWWEWASPDFHFRQPYWRHCAGLWRHITSLSWLLSQGSHGCDVAVLDPAADLATAPAAVDGQPDPDQGQIPPAAELSLRLVRDLVRSGCDADLIDDESLRRATVRDGQLRVSGEGYRVLVLAGMRWIRDESMRVINRFLAGGGVVIACARLPATIGDRQRIETDGGGMIFLDYPPVDGGGLGRQLLAVIDRQVTRGVRAGAEDLLVLHRRASHFDAYLVVNAAQQARSVAPELLARGPVELWDPVGGARRLVPVYRGAGDRVTVPLDLLPGQGVVLVSGHGPQPVSRTPAAASEPAEPLRQRRAVLDGPWGFGLTPVLDNQFGDFRLPAGPLGPEGHVLQMRSPDRPELVRVGYGPRMWWLGPLPPGTDSAEVTAALLALPPEGPCAAAASLSALGLPAGWRPYRFSERTGIENDPLLRDLQTGPHGLKGEVPPEFIDLGGPDDAPAGSVSYLWTSVHSAGDEAVRVVAGSRAAYSVWLNGRQVIHQDEALPPAAFAPWGVPDYRSPRRCAEAAMIPGANSVLIRFVHPGGMRLRGYVIVEPGTRIESGATTPALCWWAGPRPALGFDPTPGRAAEWIDYQLPAPPGLTGVMLVVRGRVEVRAGDLDPDRVTTTSGPGPGQRTVADWATPLPQSAPLRIRVLPDAGCHGGAVFVEPIMFRCAEGTAEVGDWSRIGLAAYSGVARYTRTVVVGGLGSGRVRLCLGDVAATASVRVNGAVAGTTITPPHEYDVTDLLREGANVVEIEVANTLANFYSTLPTPYVLAGQTKAGLLGPVVLVSEPEPGRWRP